VIGHADGQRSGLRPVLNELPVDIQEKTAFGELAQERGVLLDQTGKHTTFQPRIWRDQARGFSASED
jgi:hypothetical protein